LSAWTCDWRQWDAAVRKQRAELALVAGALGHGAAHVGGERLAIVRVDRPDVVVVAARRPAPRAAVERAHVFRPPHGARGHVELEGAGVGAFERDEQPVAGGRQLGLRAQPRGGVHDKPQDADDAFVRDDRQIRQDVAPFDAVGIRHRDLEVGDRDAGEHLLQQRLHPRPALLAQDVAHRAAEMVLRGGAVQAGEGLVDADVAAFAVEQRDADGLLGQKRVDQGSGCERRRHQGATG
jgi:hypothetical protein